MFFDAVVSVPSGPVEVVLTDDVEDGVLDIGWDLLGDVTPRKWQKVPPDFAAVKRDWTRWYLDESARTLDVRTLLAMYVLADNDLPYETDVDYYDKVRALIEWLRSRLADAGFDVAAHAATVTDVTASLRSYLADLPAPPQRILDEEPPDEIEPMETEAVEA